LPAPGPSRSCRRSKEELYRNAFAARSLHELGGFPVDRGRFDLGSVRVALATGAPLVPCAISGTDRTSEARAPGRARVRVEFAPAIEAPAISDARERRSGAAGVTAQLRSDIESRLAR
jgi:hypothetical protein